MATGNLRLYLRGIMHLMKYAGLCWWSRIFLRRMFSPLYGGTRLRLRADGPVPDAPLRHPLSLHRDHVVGELLELLLGESGSAKRRGALRR